MITWSDDGKSKSAAMAQFSDNVEVYTGVTKSSGSTYRTFTDIEPNKTVKPGFNQLDYYAFLATSFAHRNLHSKPKHSARQQMVELD